METVRLQNATNIPRCLSLATNHSVAEELGAPITRGEDMPMILVAEETPDTILDLLPQLVEVVKHETWTVCPLVR